MKELSNMQNGQNEELLFSSNLNPQYGFGNFIAGENNNLAKSVAIKIAKNPPQKYNPFFIYGESGIGKTHLLQSIGNCITAESTEIKVKYVRTETFTNELINNLRKGGDINERMTKFRQKYRNIDVLLLDDIQFAEDKARTNEELFHTFDTLLNNSKQIVITSDKSPKDIVLSETLINRIEKGLVIELKKPDSKVVKELIIKFSKDVDLAIGSDIIDYLTSVEIDNPSILKGIINKIKVLSEFSNKEVSLDLVKKEILTI